jgi:hypothetical protein
MTDSEYIQRFTERDKSGSVWERVKNFTLRLLDNMGTGGLYN